MAKNTNLHKAKTAKNDEFYTQLSDVANELKHYKQHFKDKVVFCNCDDPEWSAFWQYFHLNFHELGLKKLISTHYDKEKPTYKMEYTGGNGPKDDNDISIGVKTPLGGNGDFRNQECLDLLDESDIVVTNPPFSLFREYIDILIERDKKFIVIGNQNAITYKEFFPLIRDDKVWVGSQKGCLSLYFEVPDDYDVPESAKKACERALGKEYCKEHHMTYLRTACWFTNLDLQKRHEKLILWKKYSPEEFPKYDNYPAINVDKTSDIPCDYKGVMGVPITFLYQYSPDQFEIVSFRKGEDGKDLVFTREREREFNRTFVSLYDGDSRDDKKRRRQNQWENYLRENNNKAEIEPIDVFYPLSIKSRAAGTMNGLIDGKETYRRVLIQKKINNKY